MFKMQLTENHMLGITFFLVVAMAFPTYQTLTQSDGLGATVSEASLGAASRIPASLPPTPVVVKAAKPASSFFATVDLSCTKKASLVESVAGSYIQLQGKNCLPNFKDGDVEIINRSNGFTASVFPHGSGRYQTDLIQLRHGENEITIRYRERSGKTIEEILKVRSSAI